MDRDKVFKPSETYFTRRARETGTTVTLAGPGQELDVSEGWVLICNAHATISTHETLARARDHMANPCGWCEECRAAHDPKPDAEK